MQGKARLISYPHNPDNPDDDSLGKLKCDWSISKLEDQEAMSLIRLLDFNGGHKGELIKKVESAPDRSQAVIAAHLNSLGFSIFLPEPAYSEAYNLLKFVL